MTVVERPLPELRLPLTDVCERLPMTGPCRLISRTLGHALDWLEAEYQVPIDAAWAPHHLPGDPVMRGVDLIEIGNQALLLHSLLYIEPDILRNRTIRLLGTGVWNFTGAVRPGNVVTVHMALKEVKRATRVGYSKLTVGSTPVADGFSRGILIRRPVANNGSGR